MAVYPCSATQHRYRGPSQAMYPALVRGRDSQREHLRLCPVHFSELMAWCHKHLELVDYDSPGSQQLAIQVCSACGGDSGDSRLLFVTAYRTGAEEQQFYGQVCARCDPKVQETLLLG